MPDYAFSKPFGEYPMLDVVLIAVGLVFFGVAIAYTFACDRL